MKRSFHRITCLIVKELAQLRRDPRLFGLLVIAPVLELTVLGFVVTNDIRDIDIALRDRDRTSASREFARAVAASGYFVIRPLDGPDGRDERMLASGQVGLVVVIPPGFGSRLARGETASVQALVDGADSQFAVQGVSYLRKAALQFSDTLSRRTLLVREADPRGGRLPGVAMSTRVWYNPELKSRTYMVPALMAQLLMITTMLVASMALVKEREEGTLEQLLVTPIRPVELILGKVMPFVVVGFLEVTIAMPMMLWVFDVPFRGGVGFLYAISGLYLLTTLGLGLLVSTLVRTQQQAMLVSVFFVMMPFMMLSGFVFPIENMPAAIQPLAQAIPLTYYLVLVRGVFLKGVGWADLWREGLILATFGVVILGLAVGRFRKRLD
jgi:ABC-2 type transport system permease protein